MNRFYEPDLTVDVDSPTRCCE